MKTLPRLSLITLIAIIAGVYLWMYYAKFYQVKDVQALSTAHGDYALAAQFGNDKGMCNAARTIYKIYQQAGNLSKLREWELYTSSDRNMPDNCDLLWME